MTGETYLGDGLYASFDGEQIWLRAPRAGGDHCVALDAHTWAALEEFRKSIRSAVSYPPEGEQV